MKATPAQALIRCLLLEGLVSEPGTPWGGTFSVMPDDPDDAVAAFDLDADLDGRIQRTGELVKHPRVQVQIRSMDYTPGYAKAVAIEEFLGGLHLHSFEAEGELVTIEAATVTTAAVSLGQQPDRPRQMFAVTAKLTMYSTEV